MTPEAVRIRNQELDTGVASEALMRLFQDTADLPCQVGLGETIVVVQALGGRVGDGLLELGLAVQDDVDLVDGPVGRGGVVGRRAPLPRKSSSDGVSR